MPLPQNLATGSRGWGFPSLVRESSPMNGPEHGGGTASCDLSILVARTDTQFMLRTIPHLVRTCRFPFARRFLMVDTAPLGRRYGRKPGVGTAEELQACC